MADKQFIRECVEESFRDNMFPTDSVYESITEEDTNFIMENVEMTPEVERWIEEMVEFEALMADIPLEEARRRSGTSGKTFAKHQIAGMATGAAIGTAIGSGGGAAGAFIGGTAGAAAGMVAGTATGIGHSAAKKLFGKGGQRVLQDQIDRGTKKIQKWKSEPKGQQVNREKILTMEKKLQGWKSELADMKKRGDGKAGIFRSSAEKKEAQRELRNKS